MTRNDKLQALCREYLGKLKSIAYKHGLGEWVEATIKANARNECVATEQEVEFLARAVEEDRIARNEIPHLIGKSYRQCNEADDFEKIKKFNHVGIYSRVSALLFPFSNGSK